MDTARIDQAATAAAGAAGAAPVAVLPVRTTRGEELFMCAFRPGPEQLAWLVIGGDGGVVRDRQVVHDAAQVIAMCETAEEASAALSARDADQALAHAMTLASEANDADAVVAVRAAREAIAPLLREPAGVRVAEAAYLDRVAIVANMVGDRYDLLRETALGVASRLADTPGDPAAPLARALWDAVSILSRDGAPDRFRDMIEAAMGASTAFADDVVAHYVEQLEGMDE
jgi:hypothetical protein